jgi:cytochrome P450
MSRESVDLQIINPKTYADDRVSRELFAALRRDDPVHWVEVEGFEPFWAVTKHADVSEVELKHDVFINRPRGMLQSIADTERIKAAQGGNRLLADTIVSMDGEDHKLYRGLTREWFLPANVRRLEDQIRVIAREFLDIMAAKGTSCDFVKDVAQWYPLRVITMILGIPPAEEPRILQLAQESFGFSDPEIAKADAMNTRLGAMKQFFEYFGGVAEDRRKCPRDDLASVIANGTIRGEPIELFKALSYYVIVASAGHDTTSSSIAGGLLALIQHPQEMQKLRSNPNLVSTAMEEMFRWVSPVKHFFRTATLDYELRGKRIEAGQSLMLCYPSANFDEDIFERPTSFKIDRSPNRHLAFGTGPHHCLGQPLARLEAKIFFEELLARFDEIELAGKPAAVEASFVSGLKTLPIRFRSAELA